MHLISKYRTELMGLAILWTMLYHAQVHVPMALLPLQAVKSLGYAGVDIFFLLSGLGVSFSWKSHPQAGPFIAKRLKRIVPVYWFFVALSLCKLELQGVPWSALRLGDFLGLDFLVSAQLDRWFIPAIALCYGLFLVVVPIMVRLGPGRALLAGSLVALLASISLIDTAFSHLMVFTIRIPVFLLGIYLGGLLTTGHSVARPASTPVMLTLVVVALVCWVGIQLVFGAGASWRYGLWWYPTALLAYPLCCCLCQMLERSEQARRVSTRLLKPLGEHSLELYLVHGFIFLMAKDFPFEGTRFNPGRWPEYIAYSSLAIWMAPKVGRFFEALTSRVGTGRPRLS